MDTLDGAADVVLNLLSSCAVMVRICGKGEEGSESQERIDP